MPIYEYRCAACGFEKEYLQKLSDAPITDCERCGRPTMGKLVSAAGFQLKGSGWYATDFKNSGTKPKAKEEAKPKAKEESKPDAPRVMVGPSHRPTLKAAQSAAPALVRLACPLSDVTAPRSGTRVAHR